MIIKQNLLVSTLGNAEKTVGRICILTLGCKGLIDILMRRYSCMLIDTFVYSLSFTSALPLLFRSVLSTERLEKVTILSKEILCRGLHFVDQKPHQTFRLLLLCGISVSYKTINIQ